MNESDFIIDNIIDAQDLEKTNYLGIDTIRFESQIAETCSDIHSKIGVDYISFCLTLPSGTRFIVSNNPGKIAIPYHIHGLKRIDNIFCPERYDQYFSGIFHPSQIPNDRLGRIFEKIHNERFFINSVAGFHRNFLGYRLIVVFGINTRLSRNESEHQKEKHLYDYVVGFFDQFLPYYARDKPNLKYSHFYQDESFRKKLIHGNFKDISLTFKERELQCLYWARMGKTAEETSMILGLSKSTVRGYLEKVREKCDVNCIQDAIDLAILHKFIS